jgi:hypothetical protein
VEVTLIELVEARRIALGGFHSESIVFDQAHVSLE